MRGTMVVAVEFGGWGTSARSLPMVCIGTPTDKADRACVYVFAPILW